VGTLMGDTFESAQYAVLYDKYCTIHNQIDIEIKLHVQLQLLPSFKSLLSLFAIPGATESLRLELPYSGRHQ